MERDENFLDIDYWANPLSRDTLFEDLNDSCRRGFGRLAQQQVYVIGHEDVAD